MMDGVICRLATKNLMEDGMTQATQLSEIESANFQINRYRAITSFAFAALVIVSFVVICFFSGSPGMPPDELLSMTVFP